MHEGMLMESTTQKCATEHIVIIIGGMQHDLSCTRPQIQALLTEPPCKVGPQLLGWDYFLLTCINDNKTYNNNKSSDKNKKQMLVSKV